MRTVTISVRPSRPEEFGGADVVVKLPLPDAVAEKLFGPEQSATADDLSLDPKGFIFRFLPGQAAVAGNLLIHRNGYERAFGPGVDTVAALTSALASLKRRRGERGRQVSTEQMYDELLAGVLVAQAAGAKQAVAIRAALDRFTEVFPNLPGEPELKKFVQRYLKRSDLMSPKS
jgi:hypothetical protein